jgi:sugar transferase (PEP-CTERM system associated)
MVRIFGHFVPVTTAILGFAEAFVIGLSFCLGVALLDAADASARGSERFALPLLFAFAILMMMHSSGLYNAEALVDLRRTLRRGAFTLTLILVLAVAIISQLGPWQARNAWLLVALLPTIWLCCIVFTRTIFSRISRTGRLLRRVLIIGQGPRSLKLHELSEKRFGAYFLPVAQVSLQDRGSNNSANHSDRAVQVAEHVDAAEDLLLLARSVNASEIVIATEDRRGLPVHQLVQCRLAGLTVLDYLDFYERESGRVDISALTPSWFIFSSGFRTGAFTDAVKRVFDILLCLVMLVAVLPLMAFTALAIVLDSKGPILYRQERVGLHGRSFVLLKFRSMTADAERDGAPIWAAKRDPRVTRVGWVIRKLRIDELPQLYNVLRGNMSFVGPRPERPYFVSRLAESIPYYLERHSVKPGITGWAQVHYPYGASLEDARQKLSYDLFYLKNRGLFLDLIVLIRTVRVVLWPDGAR